MRVIYDIINNGEFFKLHKYINKYDEKALIYACMNKNYECIYFLVENGANIKIKNYSPLYFSYINRDFISCKYLILKGSKFSKWNKNDRDKFNKWYKDNEKKYNLFASL